MSLVEDRNMASNTDTTNVAVDTDVMADHPPQLTQLTLHLETIATFIEEAFQPKLNKLVQDSI